MLKRESNSIQLHSGASSKDKVYDIRDKDETVSPCIIQCPVVHCDNDLYTFQDRILHHKCSTIKLVRNQTLIANNYFIDDIECLKEESGLMTRIWERRYCILGLLFLLLLAWLIFLYGTILGAYICSGKSLRLCRICTIIIGITPGLQYTQNSKNIF